jgi:23S rRNA (uridine2552-2'-O)-methyltransferase
VPGSYKRKDSFYAKAKEEGVRSRAYYKLEELNGKYHILKPGYRVLDVGAWPGGWLEYAAKAVGLSGYAVGVDLVEIEPFAAKQIGLIKGDAREGRVIREALALAGGQFDVVLSDMSPKLSGIREVDSVAVLELAELALQVAGSGLKRGGSMVIKVFKGGGTDEFVSQARRCFRKLVREELESSRKTSNEYYLVGSGFTSNNVGGE